MNKKINVVIYIFADILLLFVLVFTAAQIVSLNKDYFEWHYKTHNIEQRTNFNVDELNVITSHMFKYLMDKEESLEIKIDKRKVFSERAILHMVDVKDIFLRMYLYRNISLLILFIYILGTFLQNKRFFINWISQLKKFFIISSIIIAVFIGSVLIDFENAFILFHNIVFENDLWILANDDVLVNMVPEIFFVETFMLITIIYSIMVLLIIKVAKSIKMKGSEKM